MPNIYTQSSLVDRKLTKILTFAKLGSGLEIENQTVCGCKYM